jgi:predicted ribosomally synthesized peptide with nif11-like leader
MTTDADFRSQIEAVADVEARLARIAAEGYDCTAEELAEEARRVDDAELEAVTGGQDCAFHCACYGNCWDPF